MNAQSDRHGKRDSFERLHRPCPCGSSSDAYSIRADGSGFCFSCYKNFPKGKNESGEELEQPDGEVTFDYLPWRGISKRVMQQFGVRTKVVDGKPHSIAFPYGNGLKVRGIEKKEFTVIGEFKDAGLFLQDKFDPGSRPSITIFEGEVDALSGIEMLRNESACVSIKNGAAAARRDLSDPDIHKYVDSFEKIYLCFDNDDPGKNAVKTLAGLFDFRKVYHVEFHKHKDANEYLQAKEADDFYNTWKSASRYAPDNIISSFFDIEKALEESFEDKLMEYPFPELNEKLYGVHSGEVIVVKAPEGVGKTEFFRALEHHALKTTDHPIGIIHLEEDNGTTVKAIAGYELELPATLPDCGLSKKDILAGYKRAVRDDEGRIHIYSSFDVEDEEAFYGNIRFLAAAAGCRIIYFDHISWMATGTDDQDARKKLDRISQKLKLLGKELRFAIFEISHVNDDGKTRDSRNITKVANTVISIDRDLLSGSNVMTFLVEKARLGGRTGPAGYAVFNRDKGKLEAPSEGLEKAE